MKRLALRVFFITLTIINLVSCILLENHLEIQEKITVSASNETNKVFLPVINKFTPEYYVSPIGNDTNPGTYLLPWKSIGKAAQTLSAGDTVYIRDGIYHEVVSFTISGTELNPIRIMAYPGENPIVDGEFILPGYWGTLLAVRGDYIIVSGLEVRNSAYMGVLVYGNHLVVDNMNVNNCRENGILITHGQHSIVQNCHVWRNALSNEYGNGNGWASGLSAARNGVAYSTIRHNTVWENWGEGISSYEANETIIEDNIVHDNYSANIYLSDSTNVLCQRNFVYTNPSSYVFGYGSHAGIMMGDEIYTPPSANITVINNIAYGNQGNFWWWQGIEGGGMNNVLVANNTFVNGIGDPDRGRGNVIISRGDHVNVRFENNLVRQDGELPVIATRDHPGITYSHNLWSKLPYDYVISPSDIIDDPKLVETGDPYSADWYTLSAISPAIGKALSLPEVIVDYFGNSRGSLPDMGAIEYLPD
jgi:parallel beta-helix repeat protein